MPRIVVTPIFVAASMVIVIAAFGHTLLVAQPRLCEKCERPATRLTEDGVDLCEECSQEHMAELQGDE